MTRQGCFNVPSSKWRSSFEQLRLLLSISRIPQSRLEQVRLKRDRFSLAFARSDPALGPIRGPPPVLAGVGGPGRRLLAQLRRNAGGLMGQRLDPPTQGSLPIARGLT